MFDGRASINPQIVEQKTLMRAVASNIISSLLPISQAVDQHPWVEHNSGSLPFGSRLQTHKGSIDLNGHNIRFTDGCYFNHENNIVSRFVRLSNIDDAGKVLDIRHDDGRNIVEVQLRMGPSEASLCPLRTANVHAWGSDTWNTETFSTEFEALNRLALELEQASKSLGNKAE
jgi:hypothetical protein